MRSFFLFSSFVLSFALLQLVSARATNQKKQIEQRDTSPNAVLNFVRDLFGVTSRQVCVEDDIYQEIQDYPYAQQFCSRLLDLPPVYVEAHSASVVYAS